MKYQPLDPYCTREFSIWILVTQEGYTEANAKRAVMWDELMHAVGVRKCRADGHNFNVESQVSREGGYEAFSCSRCGHAIFNRYF